MMIAVRRRTSRHSRVQELQSTPTYVDIYPMIASHHTIVTNQTELSPCDHAHPPQSSFSRRWRGRKGFGVRHVNDDIPFSLWNEQAERFRPAARTEMSYIIERYNAERVNFFEWILMVETLDPPNPVPLTVAGMPARFVSPGEGRVNLYGLAPYPSRRIPDPCPQVNWGNKMSPTKDQMCAVISAISEVAHIRRVNFLPATIVVETEHGDGRKYLPKSLPGVVANRATTYHHDAESFLNSMRSHTHERILDPAQYFPGPAIGPLPQDATDYINEPGWGILSPGMRISTGYAAESGIFAETNLSTTSGILLRKGASCCITVANHGFPDLQRVFHPAPYGNQIGDIIDRYPELDIAMVQLTPANFSRYTNNAYFQAEPPRRFAENADMVPGSWFEMDGMSTGMLSLMYSGTALEKPIRPPGHPPIPFHLWQHKNLFNMFGATSPQLVEGSYGAPLVEEETGLVAGFFHLAAGDWAECAAVDDLVAEGWEIV